MNRIFALSILLAVFTLPSCHLSLDGVRHPVPRNGILDLGNWNITEKNRLALKGEWLFNWLESPDSLSGTGKPYQMPEYWNYVTGSQYGYAVFRLKLVNVPDVKLGIYIKSVHVSYRLYANGREIMANGNPGVSQANTFPQRVPVVALLPEDEEIELLWYISNFHDIFGGPSDAPVIGEFHQLYQSMWQRLSLCVFIVGMTLMIALYNVLLWLGRREDMGSLYFSGFCFVVAIRYFVMNRFLPMFFPETDFFIFHARFELVTMAMIWFFCHNFIRNLYPRQFSRVVYNFFFTISALFVILVMLTSPAFFLKLLIPYEIVLVVAGGFITYSLVQARRRGLSWASLLLAGFVLFMLTVINDILFFNLIIRTSFELIPVGLIGLIFIQATVLSFRFARAYRTAEHLSVELQNEVTLQTTTIRRQNQELKQLNKEKTDFFINLAHEMKTPLTLIDNYLKRYIAEHPPHPDLEVIAGNFALMKKDMVNFLDMEKLNRGQLIYDHNRTTNFSELLKMHFPLYKQEALEHGLEFFCKWEDDICVLADPLAIGRIMHNLICNAFQYTPAGGAVTVTLRQERDRVFFCVADTGKGISPGEQVNIFKPYYQISRKKRNLQGIGMGLCIVDKICANLGGEIKLESELDKGTVFTLMFPSCASDVQVKNTNQEFGSGFFPAPGSGHREIPQQSYLESRKNLLLVEDNRQMVAYLAESLGKHYNFFYAYNGQEALERLLEIPVPQIIVSDIMMDEMDGFEFYETVQKSARYRGIPFIFLTARADYGDKLKCLEAGAVDFIAKPFDMRELKARIKALINLGEAQELRNLDTFEGRIRQVLRHSDKTRTDFEQLCMTFALTQREKDVIRLLLEGLEDKEISNQLHISYHTARTHIRHIYEKCHVRNRMELRNLFVVN